MGIVITISLLVLGVFLIWWPIYLYSKYNPKRNNNQKLEESDELERLQAAYNKDFDTKNKPWLTEIRNRKNKIDELQDRGMDPNISVKDLEDVFSSLLPLITDEVSDIASYVIAYLMQQRADLVEQIDEPLKDILKGVKQKADHDYFKRW